LAVGPSLRPIVKPALGLAGRQKKNRQNAKDRHRNFPLIILMIWRSWRFGGWSFSPVPGRGGFVKQTLDDLRASVTIRFTI
jgi:hypothetical protein